MLGLLKELSDWGENICTFTSSDIMIYEHGYYFAVISCDIGYIRCEGETFSKAELPVCQSPS